MYRLLVQSVVDYAIYMLTPDGIVSNWNAGAQRAKGYRAEEIVGQHFSRFYTEDDIAAELPARNLAIALKTGRFEDQGWRVRKDGSTFWAHVVIDAVRDDSGHIVGFAKITRDDSARHAAELAQREQERRFRYLVQGVTDYAIYMLDPSGHIVNWNAGAQRAKGYAGEEIIGRHFSVFYTPEDRASGLPQLALDTARNERRFEAEGWRVRKDGSQFWTNVVIDAIHDDDGSLLGFAKITRDITDRRQQELQLASLLQFLDSVISNIPASVLAKHAASDEILLANSHAQALFSPTNSTLKGRQARECLSPEIADYIERQIASHGSKDAQHDNATLINTAAGPRHLRSRTVHGKLPNDEGDYVLVITEDVTQELAAYAKIHHMAHHDGLTNLPNRTHLNERLESALQGSVSGEFDVALLCLDLDNFKSINDTFGHGFGDKILLELAKRLRASLRSGDTLARLGGDEFAVILPQVRNMQEAKHAAQRLLDAVAPAFMVDEQSFAVGISIGIALSSRAESSAEQLLRFGDLALYEAKRTGRNRFELFRPELETEALQRRQVEVDLRHALDHGELEMHYQPVVAQQGDRIVGYEALMRWQHPLRGQIPPLDFIPIAEETGLIHELGALALQLACQEAVGWPEQQSVAVNLSPVQFSSGDLVKTVAQALVTTGLAPHRLELEITESVLLDNTDGNINVLRALKQLGVRIALDDFGTGYSSLSYLRSFAFDKIKIDRSFVRDINHSREALSIIRAITGLSSSLLMEITAEGVETEEQFLRLQAEGCSHYQGYLFGRPQSAQTLVKKLPPLRSIS
ncbi:sensor domain-containing protein [Duganella guangzhouensis]|nr:bifunctional diguanylate cyclase/phosphodiesterase [Duganella guangzhouensis]